MRGCDVSKRLAGILGAVLALIVVVGLGAFFMAHPLAYAIVGVAVGTLIFGGMGYAIGVTLWESKR
jgi:hypothetical protein